MEWWENRGCKIPLAAIDKFWTKLDFSTEELNQDECNIQAEMDNLTQQLHTQPPLVVKSMLSKMKAVLNPSMTDHQPPEVQQDTRGRPTTKVKQQKNKDKQPESQSNDYTQKPNVRRSRSKKTKEEKNTLPIIDKDFPRLAGHRYKNVIERFKDWLPSSYQRYIMHIEDAQPDGNCGFRSIAMGLGYDQKEWKWVRQELLDEMFINRMRWGHILESLDKGCYDNVYRSINWLNVEPAPMACWMWLPYTGLLVAQKFGVIVQHLSNGVCQTYFPMFDGPQEIQGINGESTDELIKRYIELYWEMVRLKITKTNEEWVNKLANALPGDRWRTYLSDLKKIYLDVNLSLFIEKIKEREHELQKISNAEAADEAKLKSEAIVQEVEEQVKEISAIKVEKKAETIQTLNCVRIPDSCTEASTNDNASAPTVCDGGSRYLLVTMRVNWNVLPPPPTTMLLRQQPRGRTPSVRIGSSCCGTGY
ncbi:uncharacterized protein LOC118482654 [Helianthus annuus]|uniref:uncharacterized protein LOC118482654 n=1 Tax=Helianthus annuus TaxID=4232 RepID=UPI001652C1D5|nr:uncharacterized protein LOC118482654 [Helianthus annuus]